MRTACLVIVTFFLVVAFRAYPQNSTEGADQEITVTGEDESALPVPAPWPLDAPAVPDPDLQKPAPPALAPLRPPSGALAAPPAEWRITDPMRYEPPLPASPVEVALGAANAEPSDGSGPEDGIAPPPLSKIPMPEKTTESFRISPPVATPDLPHRMPPIAATSTKDLNNVSQPSAADVLADLSSASDQEPLGQAGWVKGVARRILVRHDPQFPRALTAAGIEVECTARITVSPAGAATRVEITGSSGYTEVDAGVEAALREFLFSREEGGNDTVGTITFRFRLEKRD